MSVLIVRCSFSPWQVHHERDSETDDGAWNPGCCQWGAALGQKLLDRFFLLNLGTLSGTALVAGELLLPSCGSSESFVAF